MQDTKMVRWMATYDKRVRDQHMQADFRQLPLITDAERAELNRINAEWSRLSFKDFIRARHIPSD